MRSSRTPASGDRLSPLDAAFLYLERPTEPLHVGALATLEGPIPFAAFAATLAQRLASLRRYRQRPERAFLDLRLPAWIDDRDYDARRHIHHVEVPAPGGDAELHALVDRLFAPACDPTAPLWETYLIDGLAGGRAAILTKVHHSMIDGISGAKVLEVMTESDDGSDGVAATDADDAAKEGMLTSLGAVVDGARAFLGSVLSPTAAVAQARAAVAAAGAVAELGRAPLRPMPFNGMLGAERRIRWATFALDDFLAMRGAAGCKVNDVVLAVIAGALRAYLLERGVRDLASGVRTLVPVNVRRADEALALGNRVSAMIASLPVDEADPLARLRRIATDMRALKERGQSRALEAAMALAGAVPPPAAPLVTRLAALRPLVNTVCTNVPGPRERRSVLGRRVLDIHPIVPLALDMGLGFAILSYAGGLSICATSDPALVPDANRLPDLLAAAADELRGRLDVTTARESERPQRAPAGSAATRVRPPALGGSAPTVGDLMAREAVTIAPAMSLAAAWRMMRERRIRHLPVVDASGRLVGLVTHRDLLAASQSSLLFGREEERVRLLARATAEEVMETHVSTVTADEPAMDAALRLMRHKIGCLPVVDGDGRLAGIVTEEDFLRWAAAHMTPSAA